MWQVKTTRNPDNRTKRAVGLRRRAEYYPAGEEEVLQVRNSREKNRRGPDRNQHSKARYCPKVGIKKALDGTPGRAENQSCRRLSAFQFCEEAKAVV